MYYDKFWMRRMEDAAGSDSYSFGRAFRDKVSTASLGQGGRGKGEAWKAKGERG